MFDLRKMSLRHLMDLYVDDNFENNIITIEPNIYIDMNMYIKRDDFSKGITSESPIKKYYQIWEPKKKLLSTLYGEQRGDYLEKISDPMRISLILPTENYYSTTINYDKTITDFDEALTKYCSQPMKDEIPEYRVIEDNDKEVIVFVSTFLTRSIRQCTEDMMPLFSQGHHVVRVLDKNIAVLNFVSKKTDIKQSVCVVEQKGMSLFFVVGFKKNGAIIPLENFSTIVPNGNTASALENTISSFLKKTQSKFNSLKVPAPRLGCLLTDNNEEDIIQNIFSFNDFRDVCASCFQELDVIPVQNAALEGAVYFEHALNEQLGKTNKKK